MRKFGLVLVGVIVGMVASIPLQAIAENFSKVGKQVEVEVPVRINGELLETPAIGLEGTTYTPVRALAEHFGAEVDWDGEAGEVVIETKSGDEQETTPDEKGDGVEVTREISKTVEAIDQEIRMLNLRNEILKEYITLYGEHDDNSIELAEIKENEARIAEFEAVKAELEAQQQ